MILSRSAIHPPCAARRALICTALAALGLALPRPCRAADTVETFDIGVTNLDLYAGLDGVGPGAGDGRAMYGDLMIGFGLVERLSAYVGATLSGVGAPVQGRGDLYLGLYGTPIDSDHLDVDLFVDFAGGGAGFREFAVTPSLEINVDLHPDQRTWGAYLRFGVPVMCACAALDDPSMDDAGAPMFADLWWNPGTYVTLAPGHQLLAEIELVLPLPGGGVDRGGLEIGAVALGYNVSIGERIELITQFGVDVPQGDERAALGVMVGMITTLPSSGAGARPAAAESYWAPPSSASSADPGSGSITDAASDDSTTADSPAAAS